MIAPFSKIRQTERRRPGPEKPVLYLELDPCPVAKQEQVRAKSFRPSRKRGPFSLSRVDRQLLVTVRLRHPGRTGTVTRPDLVPKAARYQLEECGTRHAARQSDLVEVLLRLTRDHVSEHFRINDRKGHRQALERFRGLIAEANRRRLRGRNGRLESGED